MVVNDKIVFSKEFIYKNNKYYRKSQGKQSFFILINPL